MFKAHNVAKKQHLERSQPSNRKKWGLLEKKKDYRQRAQDFHKKQAHIALLRSKASQFNEDEFDFGMIRSKTKDGVRIKDRETSKHLSNDAVKLLKTQDEGYIRTLETQERNKVERAKAGLVLPGQGQHTVFVDDRKQLQRWNAADHFDTTPELVGNRENRLRTSQLDDTEPAGDEEYAEKRIESLKELKKRVERQRELEVLRQEVDLQRELMKKGPKIKQVDGEGRVSYRWLKVRKR